MPMARVYIPASLRHLTGDQSSVDVDAATLREAVDALERRFAGIKTSLCEEDRLAPTLQVAIDNLMTRRMSARLNPDSEIHFLPAIGGG